MHLERHLKFARRRLNLNFVSIAGLWFLLISGPGWGNQEVGKALREAMQSRMTCSVDEVVENFQVAAGKTGNLEQKTSVLFLLAEYLTEKEEWEKVIPVYERILKLGLADSKPGAYYGLAKAYLMLNDLEMARAACIALKAVEPGNPMEEFAAFMKDASPNSIDGKLADLLAGNGDENQPSVGSPAGADENPETPAVEMVPLERIPPISSGSDDIRFPPPPAQDAVGAPLAAPGSPIVGAPLALTLTHSGT